MKRYLTHTIVTFLSLFLLFASCEKDLFIEDISEDSVTLISPGIDARIKSQTVNFMWEEVEDAEQYRFQLATPSFDSLQLLLIDSVTTSNTIAFTLEPGAYEWQIRAENQGSETPYTTRKIYIDSTSSLDGFQLVLSSPVDSFFTNQNAPTFSWESISIANEYNLKIVSGTDFENGTLFTSTITTSNSSATLGKSLENGTYTWGVNAENDASKTPYTTRFLWYDDIAPNKPTLTSPSNNQTLFGGVVTFNWSNSSDAGSPTVDSLFVSTDSLFQTTNRALLTSSNSVQDSLPIGTYYWRVSTTDRAGNWSGHSNIASFRVQ